MRTSSPGGPGPDRLSGDQGNDVITPDGGHDVVDSGAGDDYVLAADDHMRDVISCGPGNDRVRADGTDRVARDCEDVRRVRRSG